jgi:predicted nucleic acid-binding protein
VTVVDTSCVVDYLTEGPAVEETSKLLDSAAPAAAPDVLVFEVLSTVRRTAFRNLVSEQRATAAIRDLGDLRLELTASIKLRGRAWDLRHNLSAADALFVALAERLGEPLATRDRRMAAAAREHAGVETIEL